MTAAKVTAAVSDALRAASDAALAAGVVLEHGSEAARSRVVSTSLATSVLSTGPGRHGRRPVFESRRRVKLAPVKAKWEARARDMAARGDRKRELYAAGRASALGRDLAPAIERCGKREVALICGCGNPADCKHNALGGAVPARRPEERYLHQPSTPDGNVGERSVLAPARAKFCCRQHLVCERCLKKRARKLRARMAAGLDKALTDARELWRVNGCPTGGRPQIVLLTLTIAHSGDVARDREELAQGWREFYRRLHRRGWNGPYCGAWEATSGRDKLGHVHLHVAIVWPFIPWGVVRELWLASCPRSKSIDIASGGKSKGKIQARRDGRPTNAWSAAKYIGKYISKGIALASMGDELAADIVAATYNKRTVLTSRKFWVPWHEACCARCGVQPFAERVFYMDPLVAHELERERVYRGQLADAQLLLREDVEAFREQWLRDQITVDQFIN